LVLWSAGYVQLKKRRIKLQISILWSWETRCHQQFSRPMAFCTNRQSSECFQVERSKRPPFQIDSDQGCPRLCPSRTGTAVPCSMDFGCFHTMLSQTVCLFLVFLLTRFSCCNRRVFDLLHEHSALRGIDNSSKDPKFRTSRREHGDRVN
jgi:hypothetical protein